MVEVELRSVSKRFGDVVALESVTLRAPEGTITAVLGPSGCGKTTMLRVVAGLERPDSGRVLFGGVDVTEVPPRERNVGMVFQDLALFPHMTVLDNVAFGLVARGVGGVEARRRAREYLRLLRLEGLESRYPHQLSGGQRQRVAIARALAPEPRVLLLDEPFGALDARLREDLLWEIRRLHAERGFTAIHVTHDQAEALAIADRLAVMRAGRILREGPAGEVVDDPRSEFVARFLGANVLRLERRGGSRYGLGDYEVELEWTGEAVSVAFYPEEVEQTPAGIAATIIAVSRSRSAYRVKGRVGDEEVELVLEDPPTGSTVTFRPTELRILRTKA